MLLVRKLKDILERKMVQGFIYTPKEVEVVDSCPWCLSSDWEPWCRDYNNFPPVKCKKCGVVFLQKRLNEEGRKRFYENYVSSHEIPERLVPRLKMYQQEFQIISAIVEGGSILDVGCGSGRFLNMFSPRRYQRFGVEYGKEAVKIACRDIGVDNIFLGSILDAGFADDKFDLIIFRGVIEHLPNPRQVLEKACQITKKNGCIFLTSMPNLDCICASLYKTRWTQHREFEHIVHFTKKHFRMFFSKNSFVEVLDKELYWDTPYAKPEEDILEVSKTIEMLGKGLRLNDTSPAFWGNVLSMVFKKI